MRLLFGAIGTRESSDVSALLGACGFHSRSAPHSGQRTRAAPSGPILSTGAAGVSVPSRTVPKGVWQVRQRQVED